VCVWVGVVGEGRKRDGPDVLERLEKETWQSQFEQQAWTMISTSVVHTVGVVE
jgi:hypothetical protein